MIVVLLGGILKKRKAGKTWSKILKSGEQSSLRVGTRFCMVWTEVKFPKR